MLSHCLLKNPSERPTPTKLLKHSFFHHKGRSKDYLARTILKGLPEIGGRVQSLNAMVNFLLSSLIYIIISIYIFFLIYLYRVYIVIINQLHCFFSLNTALQRSR